MDVILTRSVSVGWIYTIHYMYTFGKFGGWIGRGGRTPSLALRVSMAFILIRSASERLISRIHHMLTFGK